MRVCHDIALLGDSPAKVVHLAGSDVNAESDCFRMESIVPSVISTNLDHKSFSHEIKLYIFYNNTF